MSDPLKQEVERRNKYGIVESNQPHPPTKIVVSRGTVLQILREMSDHWHQYRNVRNRLLKELGIDYMSHESAERLNVRLLEIAPTPPMQVTMETVEDLCKLADEAREG